MSLIKRNIFNLRTSFQNVICWRKLFTSPQCFSDMLVVHRDTEQNNPDVPFQFTEDNKKRIEAVIQNYPEGSQRSAVSLVLDIVQRQMGWIPISAMHKVAELLSMPRMRVYEWVTFYTMCKRIPRGKFHVKVCKTLPCMLRGSDELLCAVEDACCCKVGEVSKDQMFGVDLVECQGACANAPVMVIEDDYYEDLTCSDVYNIIQNLKGGCIPPSGPQNGRYAAEPICGLTSLLSGVPGPGYGLQSCLYPPKDKK